ncbi:MAG: hypothetical protein RJB60_2624 [Pseudomonadota bacterium]|jgi:parallel beta-helix repeat protein
MKFKWTFVALAATSFFHPDINAKDWYVAANGGLDSYANADNSSTKPFKSIARIFALGNILGAGDTINLACGSEWQGPLVIDSSKSLGNVSIQAFPYNGVECPSTNKPVINGSVRLDNINWLAVSGKGYFVYKLTAAESVLVQKVPQAVFDDAKAYPLARYPNAVATRNNFALAQGVDTSRASILVSPTDVVALSGNDLVDTVVQLRDALWHRQAATVSGMSGNMLSIKSLPQGFSAGDGFILENKLWMLDAPGEWYFDAATQSLYMMGASVGAKPPTKLRLAVDDDAVTVRNVANVSISGIKVVGGVNHAVNVRSSTNFTLYDSIISFGALGELGSCSDHYAVYVGPEFDPNCSELQAESTYGANVIYNNVDNSGGGSIYVQSSNATVSFNIISSTGMDDRAKDVRYGMYVRSPGGKVLANEITGSAFMGLVFGNVPDAAGNAETITGNTVSSFCLRYADCGGIYAFNGFDAKGVPKPRAKGFSTVANNVVLNGAGDYQGSHEVNTDSVVGIYLDGATSSVKVNNNVIDNVGKGILLNQGKNNQVIGNWVHSAAGAAFEASDDTKLPGMLQSNIVKQNTLHALRRYVLPAGSVANALPVLKAGVAQSWLHFSDPSLLFKGAGANTVTENVTVDAGNKSTMWRFVETNQAPFSVNSLGLGEWLSKISAGGVVATENVKKPVKPKLVNAATTAVFGSNLISNGEFSTTGGLGGWFVNLPTSGTSKTVTVSGVGGCIGPCLKFVENVADSTLISNPFAVDGSSVYYMEYLAQGAPGSSLKTLFVDKAYAGNGYVSELDKSYSLGGNGADLEQRWVERFIKPDRADGASMLAFKNTLNVPTYLDSVRVHKVTGLNATNLFDPTAYTAMVYNMSNVGVSVPCPWTSCATVIDQDGVKVDSRGTGKIALNANQRRMLFKPVEATWAR